MNSTHPEFNCKEQGHLFSVSSSSELDFRYSPTLIKLQGIFEIPPRSTGLELNIFTRPGENRVEVNELPIECLSVQGFDEYPVDICCSQCGVYLETVKVRQKRWYLELLYDI